MDISILNIIIWIWKLTFQFWKFKFKCKRLSWTKKLIFEFWIMFLESKINISIQKIID